MIKIITKKQIEYETKIRYLENDIEDLKNKLGLARIESHNKSVNIDKLLKENEKLIQWIIKMLETNGYQIKDIPYQIRFYSQLTGSYQELQNEITYKEVVIPEIRMKVQECIKK